VPIRESLEAAGCSADAAGSMRRRCLPGSTGDAGGEGDPDGGCPAAGRRALRKACSSGTAAPVTADARKMGTVKGGGGAAASVRSVEAPLAVRVMRLSSMAAPSNAACEALKPVKEEGSSNKTLATCQGHIQP